MTNTFYSTSYWQTGDGLNLWNYRKMVTLVTLIAGESGVTPFVTQGQSPDENMLFVEWSTPDREHSLSIEFEGLDLTFYAGETVDKTFKEIFCYCFTHKPSESNQDDEIVEWSELENVIQVAKNWIQLHKDELFKRNDLSKLFNY